jgi:hypothetical protein
MSVDTTNRIVFFDNERYTVNTFLAWLAENPVTCLLRLAVPIETPLSSEELAQYAALHSNSPTTTITTDSGAGMLVRYVKE